MDTVRWERVQALFHDAADLPDAEQRTFLEVECGDDVELMADVEGLLEEDARGVSMLDRDVAQVAHRIIGHAGPPAVPGADFGPYRITRVLGEGGMGVVYLAERSDLGSVAAIKILRDAWLSPARSERFASEQKILAQLNHPSIARLYDASTLPDGTPWFVMEYVDGRPLTEYCAMHGCTVAERLALFRAVCEAVQHAHRQAVVHRDLKPSNILVTPERVIKLLDFGIAKHLDSLDLPADQTQAGLRLMTPAYAAPEQVRAGRIGVYTDVYSLGVVLYELLAGRLPFDPSNRTPGEVETTILEQEPERPSVAARRSPSGAGSPPHVAPLSKTAWADLDVLCLTAMQKDPQRRYRTVDALVRDVDHYLHGEPLEARPDTVRYRVGKFVRRNWRPVSAAAVALTAVIGLVVFYTVRLTIARNTAVAEAARTQRIERFMLNLFDGGDKQVGPADSLRVVTLLDRGVREAGALGTDPLVQSELYQTLGTIYQKLGNLDQADSLLRSALTVRRSRSTGDDADVATTLVDQGMLRADQARFDDAERLVREGLAMSRRSLPPSHPAVASATAALGQILEDRGAYDSAIAVLSEAARLEAAPDTMTADLAETLTVLANSHFYAGHFATSDSLNRRVLAIDRKIHGPRHPSVADDLINLGAIAHEQGRYTDAEGFYRQALAIDEAWYGPQHQETASILTMMGRTLVSETRYTEATDLLKRALAIQEHVYGPVHPQVASALNALGNAALLQGKLDDAQADFTRMGAIYRSVYGDKHYLIGIAVSDLASVYQERGQYARAEQLYREVIRRFTESLSAEHLNTGIARIKLGRVLLSQHRYQEAESESLAGYQIVTRQAVPSLHWLQSARKDLAAEYDALSEPQQAARYRAELAEIERRGDRK